MGFDVVKIPVAFADSQNQGSQWLTIRKEKPDWVIMWGWGVMNITAIKEAAKTRFPLDRFIGNWWSGAHVDVEPLGMKAKGYKASNFTPSGRDFPVVQDVIKYVVSKGLTKTEPQMPGKVLYNRSLFMAVIMAEAIIEAQKLAGKPNVTGADVRKGFERIKLDEARLKELGFEGFTPVIGSCADHEGQGSIFVHQWNGKEWDRITDFIPPMTDIVQPLLTEAAEAYKADKPGWKTQNCS